jgi:perosamine synthetase
VGVSSWTTGALLVLKALGIGPGDEVIVPSLTFIASVNVIIHAGATPVFADVDQRTYNIDPDDIAHRITPRTRAVMPVDQIGLPCEIDRILELATARKLAVIQDAACSIGSRFRGRPSGAQAPITIFSLHARKVVTTGEGGMIVTHDTGLAERLRQQRHQGMSLSDFQRHGASPAVFETYPEVGYNFRMTDIQAAVGVAQMGKIDLFLEARRALAARYTTALSGHPWIIPPYVPDHVQHNWQSYQVCLADGCPVPRNDLLQSLHERGIAIRRGVMASHLEAPYRSVPSASAASLPHTERLAAQTLQLPLYPDLSPADADRVITELLAKLK